MDQETTPVIETPRCGICYFFRGSTCRKPWPVFGPGGKKWPEVAEDEWCGYFKGTREMELRGVATLTDAAIVRIADNNAPLKIEELVAQVRAASPQISEVGARARVSKLIATGKINITAEGEIEPSSM